MERRGGESGLGLAFHLRPREVLVPIVHGLELAAIDGNARRREERRRFES
jgi:hypothetical protein